MSASSSTFRPVTVPSRRAASVSFWIWSRPWCAASIDSLRDSVYLTGLPSLSRDEQGDHLLRRHLQLAAESAPDIRGDHAHLVLRDLQRHRQHQPQDVRDLRGRPHGELRAGRVDHHRARFHERRNQPLLAEGALQEHFGVADGLFDVAARAGLRGVERPDRADVGAEIGMHQLRAVRGRGGEIEHRQAGRRSRRRSLRARPALRRRCGPPRRPRLRRRSSPCPPRATGAGGAFMSSVIGHALGRLPCSAARSAPVKTATTPGMLRAALVSMPVMRACATGLRRIAMCCMPGQHDVVGPPGAAGDQMLRLPCEPAPCRFRVRPWRSSHASCGISLRCNSFIAACQLPRWRAVAAPHPAPP